MGAEKKEKGAGKGNKKGGGKKRGNTTKEASSTDKPIESSPTLKYVKKTPKPEEDTDSKQKTPPVKPLPEINNSNKDTKSETSVAKKVENSLKMSLANGTDNENLSTYYHKNWNNGEHNSTGKGSQKARGKAAKNKNLTSRTKRETFFVSI